VIREDRELLAELARLNKQLVTFAWRLMEARLAAAEHYEVASWLVDLAEAIQARGQRQDGLPRVFRTAVFSFFYAAICDSR
jgi:hypothetical protein